VCLTVASKTIFFVRAVDSPSFYLECNKKEENLAIRGRHALNPVYDFIMTAWSRWRLVVIELFLLAGGSVPRQICYASLSTHKALLFYYTSLFWWK